MPNNLTRLPKVLFKGVDVLFDPENETFWMTTQSMAKLFHVSARTIQRHLKSILQELESTGTLPATENVAGKVRGKSGSYVNSIIPYYNLDVILGVGYRIEGSKGAEFRRWASKILKEKLFARVPADRLEQLALLATDPRPKDIGADAHMDVLRGELGKSTDYSYSLAGLFWEELVEKLALAGIHFPVNCKPLISYARCFNGYARSVGLKLVKVQTTRKVVNGTHLHITHYYNDSEEEAREFLRCVWIPRVLEGYVRRNCLHLLGPVQEFLGQDRTRLLEAPF